MTMKLSPTQIQEIAERAEKATEERWYLWEGEGGVKAMYPFVGCADDGSGLDVVFTCDHDEGCDRDEERAFFVKSAKAAIQARQDIPALLAHIAAQDEESRRFYRADGTFETLATAEEVVAKRKEAAAKIAKLERERDEAKSQNRLDEELIADLVTGMDSWAHEEDDEVYADAWEAYCNARTRLHWEFADQKPSGEPAAPTRSTLRARIAQLESLLAVKDGALRVIANGEIVLPGGTPVEIAREALKGSAK